MERKIETQRLGDSLDERLREYPELRARMEALVGIVENADGDVAKADDAEERVVQEIRKIGREAMQGWAERKHRRVVAEFDNRDGVSRKEKNALLVHAGRPSRNLRADLSDGWKAIETV